MPTEHDLRVAFHYLETQIDLHRKASADRQRVRDAANNERTKQEGESAREYYNSPEFREEVIEAIMEAGATRMQAEGRTRDQARLFNEAINLGLM
ncbi:hypothetical protein [Ralstonia phage RP13]|nr:hypothetical protein [Ralstonia phage RP13]